MGVKKSKRRLLTFPVLAILLISLFLSGSEVHSPKAVSLYLSSAQPEDRSTFSIENFLPGDQASRRFHVFVSYRNNITLCCYAAIAPDQEAIAEKVYARLWLPSAQEELYNGRLSDMPRLTYPLSSSKKQTQELGYELTLYLDESAEIGAQFTDFTLDLIWHADETGNLCAPLIRTVMGILFGLTAAAVTGLTVTVLIKERQSKEDAKWIHGL